MTERDSERRIHAVALAPGAVRGCAVTHWVEPEKIPTRAITDDELSLEISRFESALIATRGELLDLQRKITAASGIEEASIFDAHLMVVEDRALVDEVLKSLAERKLNIERIFFDVAEKYCQALAQIDDDYLRERVIDIEDVSRRILRHMLGKEENRNFLSDECDDGKPHILIAHDLTPSDTALLDHEKVLAFATQVGGATSHTAIMARSLGIPAVAGIHDLASLVKTGDTVIVDGTRGLFIVHPTPETLEEYDRIIAQQKCLAEELSRLRDTRPETLDGHRLHLAANIEVPEEMPAVVASGAEGIGLFRTEFLFLNHDDPPNENEQYEAYLRVVQAAAPHAVVIRTLDIGGDKLAAFHIAKHEANPFLGCRAIRFCLSHPHIFKAQLRAILRASAHGRVHILLPMISTLDELCEAKHILQHCRAELDAAGIPYDRDIQIGVMIEIPAAVFIADALAREASFFSIGTNDLTQYTLAVDRANDCVARLFAPTHPAVLHLIRLTVEAAKANGIRVAVCGEMAGEIELLPLLLGLGVDELSTAAPAVPRVKRAIQSLSLAECRQLVETLRTESSPARILEQTTALAKSRYTQLFE